MKLGWLVGGLSHSITQSLTQFIPGVTPAQRPWLVLSHGSAHFTMGTRAPLSALAPSTR